MLNNPLELRYPHFQTLYGQFLGQANLHASRHPSIQAMEDGRGPHHSSCKWGRENFSSKILDPTELVLSEANTEWLPTLPFRFESHDGTMMVKCISVKQSLCTEYLSWQSPPCCTGSTKWGRFGRFGHPLTLHQVFWPMTGRLGCVPNIRFILKELPQQPCFRIKMNWWNVNRFRTLVRCDTCLFAFDKLYNKWLAGFGCPNWTHTPQRFVLSPCFQLKVFDPFNYIIYNCFLFIIIIGHHQSHHRVSSCFLSKAAISLRFPHFGLCFRQVFPPFNWPGRDWKAVPEAWAWNDEWLDIFFESIVFCSCDAVWVCTNSTPWQVRISELFHLMFGVFLLGLARNAASPKSV